MKKFIFVLPLLMVLAFAAYGAHANYGYGMMREVERQALGDESLYQEMEGMMEKMMSGNISEDERGRITQFMSQYPGPGAMMLNRLSGDDSCEGYGMMRWMNGGVGGGMLNFWFWIFVSNAVVWLAVGIMTLVWLWRKLVG